MLHTYLHSRFGANNKLDLHVCSMLISYTSTIDTVPVLNPQEHLSRRLHLEILHEHFE